MRFCDEVTEPLYVYLYVFICLIFKMASLKQKMLMLGTNKQNEKKKIVHRKDKNIKDAFV